MNVPKELKRRQDRLAVIAKAKQEIQALSMPHRLTTKVGKALYGKRKSTVETVLGIIKHAQGFRRSIFGAWNPSKVNGTRLYRLEFEKDAYVKRVIGIQRAFAGS